MGAVYKAFDPTLQRTVALKTVRPDINRQDYLDRLYREAQACARLKHPNVVTVYEAGEVDGSVYMVMEYLEGQDLSKVIQQSVLTFDTTARILMQVLDALQHAHDQHVIHRDIKPSNVYRQPDGSVKVVDFGLARILQVQALTTSGGMVMGTAHYASPEQLKGSRNIDLRTDIYSTGVMAYEMFCGRRPFQIGDDNVVAVILRVMNDPPPPMNVALTKSFPRIERIVLRAMAKSPDDRYQTAAEMRNELCGFLSTSGAAVKAAEGRLSDQDQNSSETGVAAPGDTTVVLKPSSNAMLWGGATVAAITVLAIGATLSRIPGTTASPSMPAATATTSQPVETTAAMPPPAPTSQGAPNGAPSPPPRIQTSQPQAGTIVPHPSSVAGGPSSSEPVAPIATGETPGARQLFIANTGSSAGLRYRLLQVGENGEIEIDPAAATFKTGDRVRFTFQSNIDGYLYVVQQGSSGNWTTLFPHPDINGGRNAIRRDEEYPVPSVVEGSFKLDGLPGTEHIFVFLTKEPVDQLPGLNRVTTALQPIKADVVADLQRRFLSRDLIFEKDRGRTARGPVKATYVVNPSEVGKAVAATFSLVHGQ